MSSMANNMEMYFQPIAVQYHSFQPIAVHYHNFQPIAVQYHSTDRRYTPLAESFIKWPKNSQFGQKTSANERWE